MATATETKPANGVAPVPVVQKPPREIRVVEDHSALAHLMDTAKFEHLQRIASIMASAGILPDHLRGTKQREYTPQEILGNCFKIVNQSFRWGFDPFSVMDETYVVSGKLGYQGKLVAAVINARAGLVRPLEYVHTGSGDGRTVKVIGQFEGEPEPRTIDLSVGQAKTTNDMWKKDPDQKLCYSGATKWARRHSPEVIMGVLTDDDLERIQQDRAAEVQQTLSQQPRNLGQLTNRLRGADPAGGGTVIDSPSNATGSEETGIKIGEYVAAGGEILKITAPECCPAAAEAIDQGRYALIGDLEADLARCKCREEVAPISDFYSGKMSPLERDVERELAAKICKAKAAELPSRERAAGSAKGQSQAGTSEGAEREPGDEPSDGPEKSEPRPTVSEMASLAERLGCPEADCIDWAEKSLGQGSPTAFIEAQPWRPKRGERANPKPEQREFTN